MGQIYKYVLQIHKILTQQWMWYPSINKVPEIAILFFGCQVCAAHFFETQGHRVHYTAVTAGIEILRVKFGGNLTFPFCSHQIFSLMVMKIIPVLVALEAVLLS